MRIFMFLELNTITHTKGVIIGMETKKIMYNGMPSYVVWIKKQLLPMFSGFTLEDRYLIVTDEKWRELVDKYYTKVVDALLHLTDEKCFISFEEARNLFRYAPIIECGFPLDWANANYNSPL